MLYVLIVDDEGWMRRGIRSMLQSSPAAIAEIHEAGDADEALDMLRMTEYDVLFVDIRMPGMNGLSFIETASSRLPAAAFILVSGYQEFGYMKRAIQLRVTDYLLKPIAKDELLNVFHKAVQQLQASGQPAAAAQANVLKEKAVVDLIEGRAHAGAPLFRTNPEHGRFACVSFRVQRAAPAMKESVFDRMRIDMEDQLGDALEGIVFQHQGCLHVMLCQSCQQQHTIASPVNEFVEHVLQCGEGRNGFLVQCGVSSLHADYPGIRRSYREAMCALTCSVFTPGAVRTAYEPDMEQEGHVGYSLELEKDLYNQVVLGHDAGIARTIAQMVDIAFARVRTAHALRQLLEMCWLLGERWLIESAEQPALPKSYSEFDTNPLTYDDLDHLGRELADHFCTLSLALHKPVNSDGMNAVHNMVEYIQNHYNEEISLKQLAEKHYMNAAYLSELFKDKTGMGFVAYLTSVRMKKACEYLRHPDIQINRIASLVGYRDERYFSTVFRKNHGLSPSEFRKRSEVNA